MSVDLEVAAPSLVGFAEMLTSGATARQIDHWCRTGVLRPCRCSPGSGFQRVWPAEELTVAARIVALGRAGIPPRVAEVVARGTVVPVAGVGDVVTAEVVPGVRIVLEDPTVSTMAVDDTA